MPVPDSHKKKQAYDQIRRRPGEVIGDYTVREQRTFREMTEPSVVSETPETRKLEHDAAVTTSPLEIPVYSCAVYDMVEDEDTFTGATWRQEQTGQTFFELEIRGYRLLRNARLSQEERQWSWLERETTRSVQRQLTQLRGAWDDQDLRDRDRGGKSFGKGRTVHFAEAEAEWYAEQIAHSISRDAAELEVTWSFDPDEAIWWCGVLDLSFSGV